ARDHVNENFSECLQNILQISPVNRTCFIQIMDNKKIGTSTLFNNTPFDPKDELDERLSRCYGIVNGMITGKTERETHDILNAYIARGAKQHEEVQHGLLYGALSDQKVAQRFYRDMTLVSRDGLNIAIGRINQLIHEKWLKLQDTGKTQILWVSKEFVKNAVPMAESVIHSLLRQIAGGDVSPRNIYLTEAVLDILTENKAWVNNNPTLLSTAIYTYLRVIVDHNNPTFHILRQREVDFCIAALTEKWQDCCLIGRDLVRLLQYVARIPEFEKLWQDILYNPSTLSPTFTGIHQLMLVRTSRKYLVSRLTPDMENKLAFLTTKVKFGQQKRYQEWFQRQYLSTPESQSLRCDLIRYICGVIHPSNDLLCSDVIPRWAVIGWLLTTCTSNVAASNAKLSLFYDWLFFEEGKDSIMNIEPGILVMYHSMRPHPAITATLLDFLCRIMTNFYPVLTDKVRAGIYTSLKTIINKKVLQSLSPLFDNAKLDKELRLMVRENFAPFCSHDVSSPKEEIQEIITSRDLSSPTPKPESIPMETESPSITPSNHISEFPTGTPNNTSEAEFSEDEDIPIGKLKENKFRPIKLPPPRCQNIDISELVDLLEGDLKPLVVQFQNEMDNDNQCEIMDNIVQTVIQDDDFESQDTSSTLGTCLCQLLSGTFNNNVFPKHVDDDSIEDSVGTPLFVLFRNLCQTPEDTPARDPLLILLGEMANKQPRIGYLLLYFLKVSKMVDEKMSSYKDFCKGLDRDLETSLLSDLTLCQEDDVAMFTYILPDIYTQFSNIAVGNIRLLHLITSAIDGRQLQDLVCEILMGHLVIIKKDSILSVLNASLEWESIEQYFLWQLIFAHNMQIEHIIPILPKLEFSGHAEALTSLMVQMKEEAPTLELLRPLFCRACKKGDRFTISVLKYWAQENGDRLADQILNLISKCTNSTPNRKRHKQSSKKDGPSTEQILNHLEHMRQVCQNISFLNHESMQQALFQALTACSDAQKARFGDLFALAEDFEEVRSTRVLRQVPSRRASEAAKAHGNLSPKGRSKKILESETESESSEDEEIGKPRPKKRKKATVDDDSD
ncbi:unnamed protein product, partial [Owenia fusiformis]